MNAPEPLQWREVVSPVDKRIITDDGVYCAYLKAGEPTKVNEKIFFQALAQGCSIPGGTAGIALTDDEIIEKLVEVMIDIVTEGDETKLTKTGEPRYAFLKDRVGQFSSEHKDAAWERVSDLIAGSDADQEEESPEEPSDG